MLLDRSTDKEIIGSRNEVCWCKKKNKKHKVDTEGIFNAIVEVLKLLKLSESVGEYLLNIYKRV